MILTLVSGTTVHTQRIAVRIDDRGGDGSVRAIKRALTQRPGVTKFDTNPAGAACVGYDPTRVNPNDILGAVATLGFRTGELRILES